MPSKILRSRGFTDDVPGSAGVTLGTSMGNMCGTHEFTEIAKTHKEIETSTYKLSCILAIL